MQAAHVPDDSEQRAAATNLPSEDDFDEDDDAESQHSEHSPAVSAAQRSSSARSTRANRQNSAGSANSAASSEVQSRMSPSLNDSPQPTHRSSAPTIDLEAAARHAPLADSDDGSSVGESPSTLPDNSEDASGAVSYQPGASKFTGRTEAGTAQQAPAGFPAPAVTAQLLSEHSRASTAAAGSHASAPLGSTSSSAQWQPTAGAAAAAATGSSMPPRQAAALAAQARAAGMPPVPSSSQSQPTNPVPAVRPDQQPAASNTAAKVSATGPPQVQRAQAESRQLVAQPSSESAAASAAPKHADKARTLQQQQQQKPPAELQVEMPEAQLMGEPQQLVEMETEFLRSLHDTRVLQAQLLEALPQVHFFWVFFVVACFYSRPIWCKTQDERCSASPAV